MDQTEAALARERRRQAENCVLFGHIGRPGTQCTRCGEQVPEK